MGGKDLYLKRKMKWFSVPSIAAVALLAPFILAGCQSNAASSTIDSSSMDSSSSNEVELVEIKPEVAEVEVNNAPNRIITTLNGDT